MTNKTNEAAIAQGARAARNARAGKVNADANPANEVVNSVDDKVTPPVDETSTQGMNFFEAFESMLEDYEEVDPMAIIAERIAQKKAFVYRGIKIRSAVMNQRSEHTSVQSITLNLARPVPGLVEDKDTVDVLGMPTRKQGAVKTISMADFSLAASMKDIPEVAVFATSVRKVGPLQLNGMLADCEVDVLVEFVPEGEEYTNPFSQTAEPINFEGDRCIYNIVGMKPSKAMLAMRENLLKALF